MSKKSSKAKAAAAAVTSTMAPPEVKEEVADVRRDSLPALEEDPELPLTQPYNLEDDRDEVVQQIQAQARWHIVHHQPQE